MSLLRNNDYAKSINFQKASCTLDGCVKIWTSRVDSVGVETTRLLSGLANDPSTLFYTELMLLYLSSHTKGGGNDSEAEQENEDEEDEQGRPITKPKKVLTPSLSSPLAVQLMTAHDTVFPSSSNSSRFFPKNQTQISRLGIHRRPPLQKDFSRFRRRRCRGDINESSGVR